ncbi:hypothetical protein NE237_026245 [Protea cynaroides]|uniref:Protein SCAI n=1 Tax=Protea cynaroides TaxID=273540 RepID=A0A9Q0K0B1_9MAGN|nr:hypothetical protein NE237_026245 [Protea cynaroides]
MAQNNIPISEVYWTLSDKADKKFKRIRDSPYYDRDRNDDYFTKVFKVYTQLWKFQQENRQMLVEAGVKRWEIGEIASRIAQLYYGQYLRTSEANYLSESYVFYEAILTRGYFKEGSMQEINVANKQLRCIVRFLIVSLILNRRDMVNQMVNQLKMSVDECKRSFQDDDFREWRQVVQEIVRFLKVDTAFMNMRPLRYSLILDSHLESLPFVGSSFEGRRVLKLQNAILSSYHLNEVKFMEVTLDTFRILQCLEWEPSGSFYRATEPPNGGNGSNLGGASTANRIIYSQDITDPTLPLNPRKAILYHPAVTHFIAVLATMCEELPPDGVLLVYLSASGKIGNSFPLLSSSGTYTNSAENTGVSFHDVESDAHTTSSLSSLLDSPTSSVTNKGNRENRNAGFLWLGSRGNEGLNCLYPSDLIPFTRRPLFLIIDSDSSQAFKALHGAEKGEPVALLLSPSYPSTAIDSSRHHSGSQFTMFLTAPLQAFCHMLGLSGSNIDMDKYNMAEHLLSLSLSNWGSTLTASDILDPAWAQVLHDPFLRRLILRFIFCRAVLTCYAPTFRNKDFLPDCLPHLPDSVSPLATASQTAIFQIAQVFDVANHFIFSHDIILPENNYVIDKATTIIIPDSPEADIGEEMYFDFKNL